MKIVCGSCGSKYAIADEKLAGRAIRIRCKKCGEAIAVRSAEAAPFAQAPAEIWHVLVDGEQRGPMSASELGSLLRQGTLGWDAYVWREGFDEWKTADTVEALVTELLGGREQRGARSQDLFAPEAASPFASSDASLRTESDAAARTGARNESSVLFSLASLSSLGASSARAAAPSASIERAHGGSSGDGSGLIDIRALASATGRGRSFETRADPVEALLALAAPAPGLGSALAPSMVLPATRAPSGTASATIVAAVILAVGLVGGASALAFTRTGDAVQPPPPVVTSAPPVVVAPFVAPPVAEATRDVTAREEPEASVATPILLPARPSPRRPDPARLQERVEAPPAERPTAEQATSRQREDRTLADLVAEAAGPVPTTARETHRSPADPALAVTPGRPEIMSAMSRVQPAVAACGGGEHGIATVRITLSGATGHVTNAVVSGAFAGTPVGSCVALATRGATVPPFSQSTFAITYPFRL